LAGGGEEFEGSENITFEMPSVHWLNRERRGFIVYLLNSALLTAKICDKYNNMLLLLLLLINGFRKEFPLSQAACLLSFINKTNVTKATLKCENQRTIKYLPIRRGESLSTILFIYMH